MHRFPNADCSIDSMSVRIDSWSSRPQHKPTIATKINKLMIVSSNIILRLFTENQNNHDASSRICDNIVTTSVVSSSVHRPMHQLAKNDTLLRHSTRSINTTQSVIPVSFLSASLVDLGIRSVSTVHISDILSSETHSTSHALIQHIQGWASQIILIYHVDDIHFLHKKISPDLIGRADWDWL